MKIKIHWSLKKLTAISLMAAIVISGCASKSRTRKWIGGEPRPPATGGLKSANPYKINGITYYPIADAYGFVEKGVASWYGNAFHGKPTASGETYNMRAMTAAHKTLPLQTIVEVTRLDTGKKIVVRINDRGPFVNNRVIDLSKTGAQKLNMIGSGTAPVRVVALAKGKPGRKGSPPEPVEPLPDFNHGTFWVQVGAFGAPGAAERVRERLLLPVGKIRLQPVSLPGGRKLVRVQVGPFGERSKADDFLAKMMGKGYPNSFVVAGP